jgi:hypothetical protein
VLLGSNSTDISTNVVQRAKRRKQGRSRGRKVGKKYETKKGKGNRKREKGKPNILGKGEKEKERKVETVERENSAVLQAMRVAFIHPDLGIGALTRG